MLLDRALAGERVWLRDMIDRQVRATNMGTSVEQREDGEVERLPRALCGERRAEVGRRHVGHGEGGGGGCGGGEGRRYGGEMSEVTQAVHLEVDEF